MRNRMHVRGAEMLYNSGLMQLERRKVKGYKLLYLLKTIPNRA